MLQSYSSSIHTNAVSHHTVELFVRQWLTDNSDLVTQWVPSDASKKPELLIGGLFPLWEHAVWREPSLVPGV